jgi:hypothetical protein
MAGIYGEPVVDSGYTYWHSNTPQDLFNGQTHLCLRLFLTLSGS